MARRPKGVLVRRDYGRQEVEELTDSSTVSVEQGTAEQRSAEEEEDLKGTNPGNGRFRFVLQLMCRIVFLVHPMPSQLPYGSWEEVFSPESIGITKSREQDSRSPKNHRPGS